MNQYRVCAARALNGRIQGWAIEVRTSRGRWYELDYYPVALHGASAHQRAMTAAHKSVRRAS